MTEKTVGKKERRAAQEESPDQSPRAGKLKRKEYEAKLDELHMELVRMQFWIKAAGKKLVVLFEGRDAAGKGGAIKCVAEPLNPRGCRIVALGKASDTERSQTDHSERAGSGTRGRRPRPPLPFAVRCRLPYAGVRGHVPPVAPLIALARKRPLP